MDIKKDNTDVQACGNMHINPKMQKPESQLDYFKSYFLNLCSPYKIKENN